MGEPGIGKSTIVKEIQQFLSDRNKEHFKDGVLYFNLIGAINVEHV